ncbi:MAG: thioredoxin domain-containing protein [Roseiarcus sp.]
MPRTRRPAFLASALIAAALAIVPSLGFAEAPSPPSSKLAPPPPNVPMDQLMSAPPIPDIVQGSPNAPSTIIEYASLTCTHCAAFYAEVWPQLKAKYVDTGEAKFILREFPLDPLATAAFMLARCAGADKRNEIVDALFSEQKTWAFVDQPIPPLIAIVVRAGMTEADLRACLKNQELYDAVENSRDHAAKAFSIDSTPTFFVDGRKLVGEQKLADFDRWLAPGAK